MGYMCGKKEILKRVHRWAHFPHRAYFPHRAHLLRVILFLFMAIYLQTGSAMGQFKSVKRQTGSDAARSDTARSDNLHRFSSGGYEEGRGDLCLMWYNVENLFHPGDDSLVGDDEFTPAGVRGWSYKRYNEKLTRLARVIVAAGRWQAPGIVGLCEVENPQVLEDLVTHSLLAPYQYSYIHRDGPDHRGMDVACLFRPERFTPLGWEFFSPAEGGSPVNEGSSVNEGSPTNGGSPAQGGGMDQTREMLHLQGRWGRRDSLDLILVHFISRYRGAGLTATYRRRQAEKLAGLIDSLSNRSPTCLVVVGGDFNDTRDAWSLEPLSDLSSLPSEEFPSYKYRGVWSGIDFFLVSGAVYSYRFRGAVFKNPRLLKTDLTYGGEKPKRTYEGYSYAGGYSDHLPVLLDISRSPFLWGKGP